MARKATKRQAAQLHASLDELLSRDPETATALTLILSKIAGEEDGTVVKASKRKTTGKKTQGKVVESDEDEDDEFEDLEDEDDDLEDEDDEDEDDDLEDEDDEDEDDEDEDDEDDEDEAPKKSRKRPASKPKATAKPAKTKPAKKKKAAATAFLKGGVTPAKLKGGFSRAMKSDITDPSIAEAGITELRSMFKEFGLRLNPVVGAVKGESRAEKLERSRSIMFAISSIANEAEEFAEAVEAQYEDVIGKKFKDVPTAIGQLIVEAAG